MAPNCLPLAISLQAHHSESTASRTWPQHAPTPEMKAAGKPASHRCCAMRSAQGRSLQKTTAWWKLQLASSSSRAPSLAAWPPSPASHGICQASCSQPGKELRTKRCRQIDVEAAVSPACDTSMCDIWAAALGKRTLPCRMHTLRRPEPLL